MKIRKLRSLICGMVVFMLFTGLSVVNVHAEGKYSPLSVDVEISGKGTYVLEGTEADDPMPEVTELTLNGKGQWVLNVNEPGTYHYTVFNKNKTDEKKDVTVFVTNDEEDVTKMNAAIIFEENGQKASGDFPVPTEKPVKKIIKKTPYTGDRNNLWIYILIMAGSLMVAGMALHEIRHTEA